MALASFHPRRAAGLDGEWLEEEEEAVEEEEEEDGKGQQQQEQEASCAVCGGCWDEGGSAPFPYHRCRKCGLLVHAACRPLAHAALTCPPPPLLSLPPPSSSSSATAEFARRVNRHGVVTLRVRQAYDVPCSSSSSSSSSKGGERVYVVCRLLPWPEKVRTPVAVLGPDGVALWGGDAGTAAVEGGGATAASAASPRRPSEPSSAEGSACVSLLHPYNSAATPAPVLRLELWSSPYAYSAAVTSLLDKCLGAAGT